MASTTKGDQLTHPPPPPPPQCGNGFEDRSERQQWEHHQRGVLQNGDQLTHPPPPPSSSAPPLKSSLAISFSNCERAWAACVRAEPDDGTTALLIPATCAFSPKLGFDSYAKHTAAAEEAGTPLTTLDLPRVAFDMDSFDDMIWAGNNIPGVSKKLYDWQAWLQTQRPKENA